MVASNPQDNAKGGERVAKDQTGRKELYEEPSWGCLEWLRIFKGREQHSSLEAKVRRLSKTLTAKGGDKNEEFVPPLSPDLPLLIVRQQLILLVSYSIWKFPYGKWKFPFSKCFLSTGAVSNGNGIPSFKVLTPYYPYIPLHDPYISSIHPLCTSSCPVIPHHTLYYSSIQGIFHTVENFLFPRPQVPFPWKFSTTPWKGME
jgi:hypothetical protein